MTCEQLLLEICNRAGEGYENYTARAKHLFEAQVRNLIYNSRIGDLEAPGLCRNGVYAPILPTKRIPLSVLLTAAGITEGKLRSLRYSTDTRATLTTDLAGSDNNITFMALSPGTDGNKISIEYIKPAANNTPLSITVATEETAVHIQVTLATNEDEQIDTDAQTLAEAIAEYESVYWITASIKDGETGAGLLTVMAKTYLAGGSGDGTMTDMERVTYSQYLQSLKRPDILTTHDSTVFYHISGTSHDPYIELLTGTIGAGSNMEYSVLGWNDTWLNSPTYEVADLFTPQFLEMLIQASVTALRGEILS